MGYSLEAQAPPQVVLDPSDIPAAILTPVLEGHQLSRHCSVGRAPQLSLWARGQAGLPPVTLLPSLVQRD